jgi:hypothetical protein
MAKTERERERQPGRSATGRSGSCSKRRCGCSQGTIEGRFDMTDLERLGLALVGFAVAVVSAGVLLGLIGAWIKRGKR